LKGFAQQGQQTVVELTDKEGGSWKIQTVETPKVTTYSVISSSGQVEIMAAAFGDGAKHAVVFVDSTEKEKVLAVLDKKFLSGLTNVSDEYKKWVEKNAVFTYGGVQETLTIDARKGGLGSTNIGVEGGKIVGRANQITCNCETLLGSYRCGQLLSPITACINAVCNLVNCISGIPSGASCAGLGEVARVACNNAAANPQ
jgi:hypothetical protein